MLETLITSKTRVKLLLKFFLNPNTSAYLRGLTSEFGESSNAVRLELNRLEKAGMLNSKNVGNKKIFQVNKEHSLFDPIHHIVQKYIGLDKIIDFVIKKLGNLEAAYLCGDLAKGKESDVIDLIFIGDINRSYLNKAIEKAQRLTGKKIKYLIYESKEGLNKTFNGEDYLLIWTKQ
ncbi:MAG TPA: ArsR family transcriptional regulator [Flavobacteriales bacterium]|nr:ArsR family transcriptional regulator [Flavobacteriales bacterium]